MKNKILTILLILLATSFAAIYLLSKKYIAEKVVKDRYFRNIEALTDSTEYYKTAAGALVALNSGLELTTKELKSVNRELTDKVKSLNLKLKNVESITRTETVFQFVTRDSIIYLPVKDTSISDVRKFLYSDNWVRWEAVIENCSTIMPGGFAFSTKDSILTAVEIKYKRRFIFWKRPAGISVHTSNANPYSTTEKSEYIKITK